MLFSIARVIYVERKMAVNEELGRPWKRMIVKCFDSRETIGDYLNLNRW
jgi:hypothetical protein